MNKIILYEHPDFTGLSKEFTNDVPNLIQENFNDCASAVKVIGNPWVCYEHPDYKGNQYIFEEGEHANVPVHDVISSLRLVRVDLSHPQITVYEHPDYQGRSLTLISETNLMFGDMNDMISSYKVQSGAWVLYEHPNRGGFLIVAIEGEDKPKLDQAVRFPALNLELMLNVFDNRVSHVRPLLPGKPSIKAEIQWDQKDEQVKSVAIDSISGANYGNTEQTFSTELSREYEGSVTESFSFSNSTEISMGVSFGFDIGGVNTETNLSISNTFTVEKGSSNTRTEKKSVKIDLPVKTPPHTKLTVNVIRKEVSVKVPVKLTITSGLTTKTEYGEYRCESGKNISAEFREEKL